MKKVLLTILFLSLISLVSTNIFAEGKNYKKNIKEEIFKDLDLTADQQKALKKLNQQKKGKLESFKKMKAEKEAFNALLIDPKVSDQEIRNKALEMRNSMQSMHDEKINHLLEIRKILTPEQLEKMLDKMEEKKGSFKKSWKK